MYRCTRASRAPASPSRCQRRNSWRTSPVLAAYLVVDVGPLVCEIIFPLLPGRAWQTYRSGVSYPSASLFKHGKDDTGILPDDAQARLNQVSDQPIPGVAEILALRSGEELELNDRYLNPQMGRILRTLGFDRIW